MEKNLRYEILKLIKEANEIVEIMNDCDEESYSVLSDSLYSVLDILVEDRRYRTCISSLNISKRGFYYVKFSE